MENAICRILMLGGLVAGVLLAGGDGSQALAPAIVALLCAAVARRLHPLVGTPHGGGRARPGGFGSTPPKRSWSYR